MKKQTLRKPTRGSFTLLRQLCNLIPAHLVPQLARDSGVAEKARTFTPWSHVVSLLFAQLAQALGLNDVCDALRLNAGPLSALRGAKRPQQERLLHRQSPMPGPDGPGPLLAGPRTSAKPPPRLRHGNMLRDDLIRLTGPARKHYPVELRRVIPWVEVDGRWREMTFLTNHLEWSAPTLADLYRCRWEIEVLFLMFFLLIPSRNGHKVTLSVAGGTERRVEAE